ncbi:hypothetical protein DNTS_008911 [Danionella cerebrum]|uniref:ATP-dependent RNA helicase n=1 Tax=Danionella cerebrum TaxID=2873325 RepID=A0A553NW92_9TELE|nr:hypothetical protein DNTS_008911 [Danionella translucida]
MKLKKARGRLVPGKQEVQVQGKWKALNLEPSLFSNEGLEGLVCVEELSDYTLISAGKTVRDRASLHGERMEQDDETTARKNRRKASKFELKEPMESAVEEKLNTKERKGGKQSKKKKKRNVATDEQTEFDEHDARAIQSKNGGKINKKKRKKCDAEDQVESDDEDKNKKKRKGGTADQRKRKDRGAHEAAEEGSTVTQQPSRNDGKKKMKRSIVKSQTAQAGGHWSQVAQQETAADVSAWKDLFIPRPVLKALSTMGFAEPTHIQSLSLPAAIRDRLDILAAAETDLQLGSGKTLCFGIPLIHTVLQWRKEADRRRQKEQEPEENRDAAAVDLPPEDEAPEQQEDEEDVPREHDETVASEDAEGSKGEARRSQQPLLGLVLTPTRELAFQVKHHIDALAQFTGIRTAIVVGGMSAQKQRRMLSRRPELVIATPGRMWEMIRESHAHLQNLKELR